MDIWSRWLWGAAMGFSLTLSMTGLLHLLQLESYQFPGYFRALRRTATRALLPGLILTLAGLLAWIFLDLILGLVGVLLACALPLGTGVALFFWQRRQPAKKALKYTPRVRRLLVALVLVNLLIACAAALWLPLLCVALLPLLNSLWLALAALLVTPVERAIARWYFRDAQKKLAQEPYRHILRIGVTGSYGKTSVKFILGALLSEKYRTLVTPESYNTPMGVTRIIREQLLPEHEVFIAEMGARHVGDIREMCDLVSPKAGILTAIGPQHLETFGSLERVASTKYELIEALPEDGVAFFARDGGLCEELYGKCPLGDKHLAGENLSISGVELGTFGSRFWLTAEDGERVQCHTVLLGRHNIQNILLAATAARRFGLSLSDIARGIEKIAPIENRLQVLDSGNGVMVINDGFSGNPSGAAAALAVLRDCPGRRFLVTPGMVEMGEGQAEANRVFGGQMNGCVDVAILVGHINAGSLRQGLLEGGFDAGQIHQVDSLDACQALLAAQLRAGDTVLFENDLPENYR